MTAWLAKDTLGTMALLKIDTLTVDLARQQTSPVRLLHGVSFSVETGAMVAVVGESGSGKSLTARSILGLLPSPLQITGGRITLDGTEIVGASPQILRTIRGGIASMIFQEPMTSLNPVLPVGRQIIEVLELHGNQNTSSFQEQATALLTSVGISDPVSRLKAYPHQLSGGMRQRVMIAMALAGNPKLLIADEPTTALDVTVERQILTLIDHLRATRTLAVLLISHDLAVIADRADQVVVMYAGLVVESGPTKTVLEQAYHPYTQGLLASRPGTVPAGTPLHIIPGNPPLPGDHISGCPFAPRCSHVIPQCSVVPPVQLLPHDRMVRCWTVQ